jgi:hypothetical protein
MTTDLDERKTFCSAKGITLKLRPVGQFKLDALRTSKVEVPIPQYQMTIAGGQKVDHPMDEIIAKNQNRMDEWLAYKREVAEQNRLQAERFSEMVIYDGVDIEVPGPDSEWQRQMDHFGIKIPDEPIARKLKYVYSEALVGPEDLGALVSQIMSISQVDEEVIAKMRASFRVRTNGHSSRPTGKGKGKVEKQEPDVQ